MCLDKSVYVVFEGSNLGTNIWDASQVVLGMADE